MPVKWYSSLVLICLLGVALVVYSRYERQHPAPAVQPAIGAHWFQALGFDVCGTVQPNLPGNPNASVAPIPGIRTDGDGVIQVAPTTTKDSGNNATLARFVALYPRLVLTPSAVQLPGKPKYVNGQTCPAGSPDAGKHGQVEIKMWPSFASPGSNNPVVVHDPGAIKLADEQLITVAFVPSGASVPKPSSITALLTDRAGSAASTSSTVAPPVTPTSVPTTATTATTKPASTATTATTLPSPRPTTPTTAATSTTKAK
jgi:predicted pyridoxine 5'-phosphate oxidase superfamily flavin-nucleotide-binding protein